LLQLSFGGQKLALFPGLVIALVFQLHVGVVELVSVVGVVERLVLVKDESDPRGVRPGRGLQGRRGVQLVLGALEDHRSVGQRDRQPAYLRVHKVLAAIGMLVFDLRQGRWRGRFICQQRRRL